MKLTKIEQVNEFLSIVDSCKGEDEGKFMQFLMENPSI